MVWENSSRCDFLLHSKQLDWIDWKQHCPYTVTELLISFGIGLDALVIKGKSSQILGGTGWLADIQTIYGHFYFVFYSVE